MWIVNCYDHVSLLPVLIAPNKPVDVGALIHVAGKTNDTPNGLGTINDTGYNKLNSYGADIPTKITGPLVPIKGPLPINPADPDVSHGYCCNVYGHCDRPYEPDECSLETTVVTKADDPSPTIVDYGNDLIHVGMDYICEHALSPVHSLLPIGNGASFAGYHVDTLVMTVDNPGADIVTTGESPSDKPTQDGKPRCFSKRR